MSAISPTKNNFWPRPRDQNTDTLLRAVIEVQGDSIITFMAVFNNLLYFAGQHPTGPTNAPRLYVFDPNVGVTAIALPGAFASAGNTQITGMVVFNNQLWIVSGNSAVAADNGQIWVLDINNNWVAGPAPFAFPGWTGGPAANMIPRIFLYGGNLVVAALPLGVGAIELHTYTGVAWALEAGLAAGDMTTPTQVDWTATGTLYFGVGGAVWQRDAAGVHAFAFQFPLANNVVGLVAVNGELWAAQAPGAATPLLACAQPAASQMVRVLLPGARYLYTVSSSKATLTTSEVVLVCLASGEIMILEDDDSLRTLVRSEDDGNGQIITFRNRYYVAQGSVDLSTVGATGDVTARIAIIE